MTTLFTEAMNVSKFSLGSVWLKINGSHWPAASSHWLRPLCGLCQLNTPFLIQLSHPWFPYHELFGFFFPISTGPSQAYLSSSVPRGEVFSRTLCPSLLPLWHPISLNAVSSVWTALSSWFLVPDFLQNSRSAFVLSSEHLHLLPVSISILTNQNGTCCHSSHAHSSLFLTCLCPDNHFLILQSVTRVVITAFIKRLQWFTLCCPMMNSMPAMTRRVRTWVIRFSSLCLQTHYAVSYLCLSRKEFFISDLWSCYFVTKSLHFSLLTIKFLGLRCQRLCPLLSHLTLLLWWN